MSTYEKRGYLLENFKLFHLRTEGQKSIDFHYHEFCKLLFLVTGSGGYFIDGRRYLLQSGDILLLGSHNVHRPELEDSAVYERIILYISPEFLKEMSTEDCDLLDIFTGEQSPVLRLKDKQRKQIFDKVSSLELDLAYSGYGHQILQRSSLLNLLVDIGRNLSNTEAHRPSPEIPTNGRVKEILRYIDDNITEEFSIAQLAQKFYISKYHMMRLFHENTGETVHNYITVRRLLLARELIESGMRATEACYRCGFRSYSSFTRAYNKHFASTPTGRTDKSLAQAEGFE